MKLDQYNLACWVFAIGASCLSAIANYLYMDILKLDTLFLHTCNM